MFFKIDYSKLLKLKLYLEVKLGNLVLEDDIGLQTRKCTNSSRGFTKSASEPRESDLLSLLDLHSPSKLHKPIMTTS